MNIPQRRRLLGEIEARLFRRYGDLACPLLHADAWQLLVAVVLSGQCRDDRVNTVTPALFARFPDAAAMAEADQGEVERLIKSCGLFRAKAANIIRLSQQIRDEFAGRVPRTMDELTRLAGVGRKSANVVLGNAFGLPGFPVDTHVRRLLNRLGAVETADPEKIEMLVDAVVAPEKRANFSHMLIQYGRDVCDARKPDCADCVLNDLCPTGRKNLKDA